MAMTAFSCGGFSQAICSELKPEYEVPYMPTLPSHQPCSASHPMTSARSRCSRAGYSSVASPPDEPVPRRSSRHTAYENSSRSRVYSGRYEEVRSSLRYGSASRMHGCGPMAAPGAYTVADRDTPSSIGMRTSKRCGSAAVIASPIHAADEPPRRAAGRD